MSYPWLWLDPLVNWEYWVGVVAIAVSYWLWLERKRSYRFKSLRSAALLVIAISLLGLILRPEFLGSTDERFIILLTSGYSKNAADSLLKEHPNARVLRTINAEAFRKAEKLSSYYELSDIGRNIRFVLGEGLPYHALGLIHEKKFKYIPASMPLGITSLETKKNITVNKETAISGVVNQKIPIWITLEGPGGKEDSAFFSTPDDNNFELSFIPKQSGRFIYKLLTADSLGNLLDEQPVPLEVLPERKLNVLFIQHFPTFETSYLKNFLASRQHSVSLRYQLSRGTYRFENINSSLKNFNKLDESLLNTLDLLLVDIQSLLSLSRTEREDLKQAIESGLGMIVLFHTSPEKLQASGLIPFDILPDKADTVHISLDGTGLKAFEKLPFQIKPQRSIRGILENGNGKILSGYQYAGFGKTGFQLLTETYQFLLNDKPEAYARCWNTLLEKTARTHVPEAKINILTAQPVFPDEPVDVEVISNKEAFSLSMDGIAMPLAENMVIDDLWKGTFWVAASGWHSLHIPDSLRSNFYIHKPGDWPSLRIACQMNENRKASISESPIDEIENASVYKPLSPLIFLLLFLIGSGWLWLSPKL